MGSVSELFRCVTTTNHDGWKLFGRNMARSFVKRWPSDIKLTVYAEDFEPDVFGIEVRRMPGWLQRFKEAHGDHATRSGRTYRGYDFRFDAIKFSHKVAALTDFSCGHSEGIDIWIDADTYTHDHVSNEWLEELFPDPNSYMAWLERRNSFPECGFVMYRTSNPFHKELMSQFAALYQTGNLFSAMAEWHDSFVLQQLVLAAVRKNIIRHPYSLSGDIDWSHPFVNGPLGAKIDHMKGPRRKKIGRSLSTDCRRKRNEEYWKRFV
jgi:hypothetical protein